MIPLSSSRRERIALLVGILCVFFALKLAFNPGLGRNSLDGDYYYQVARHVAEGDGLQTSISLYHQGLKELPHKTNISPLWPLMLGWSGRIFGLYPTALLLPELLFLLNLILLYVVTNRLVEAWLGEGTRYLLPGGQALDHGHVAVVLFGTNPIFFEFTSLPYTESLAFFLLLCTLLAVDRLSYGASLKWAALAGVLAGLAFMTRSQMIGLVAALPAALLLLGLRQRKYLFCGLISISCIVLVLIPWLAFLGTFVEDLRFGVLVGLGALRETPEIAPFSFRIISGSVGDRLLEIASGFGTAFNLRSPDSYVASFGVAAFMVPLAFLVFLIRSRRVPEGVFSVASGRPLLPFVVLLTPVAMLAPIHWSHFRFFREWLFGFRHGLPFILLLLLAMTFLLARSARSLRFVALALISFSVFTGSFEVAVLLGREFRSGLLGPEPELVKWLDGQDPRPRVVTTNAQTLSVFSRSGFHWMECREDAEKTEQLLDLANADYVLMYASEERCNFLSRKESDLEFVRAFGEDPWKISVFERRTPEQESAY